MTKLFLYQLRVKNIPPCSDFVSWLALYHQHIVINLPTLILAQEINTSQQKPIILRVNDDKSSQILNNIILSYAISDYKLHLYLQETIDVKKSKYALFDKKRVFDEVIDLIQRNSRYLPIKTLYFAIDKLLTKEDCQTWFSKNVFTIKKYCELIKISVSTFKRAR